MKQFSIPALTEEAYSHFPESVRRPVIGLTANHSDIDVSLRDAYHKQIVEAGGVPFVIPPVADVDVVSNTLDHIDALILTGGGDYDPRWCDEEPSPRLGTVNPVRDPAELLITRLAYNRGIPMLGICRGMQTLAVALGGHVAQDISEIGYDCEAKRGSAINHSQTEDRPVKTHSVDIDDSSTLFIIYSKALGKADKTLTIGVNSFHHQCVDDAGELFHPVAWAPDGVMEAMESAEHKPIMGVQWHPEWLAADGLPIFRWLTEQAALYQKAKDLHAKHIVLDTHCDTPMFFHQGVDFLKRDDRIKVDLHKMTDGRQDATIMVCYLPQPREGKTFRESIDFDIQSPYDYTNFIFDEIGKIVARAPQYVALARTEADIRRNKSEGKRSIVLGVENGLAICPVENGIPLMNVSPADEAEALGKLRSLAGRGIVYMTLSHNGDNAICDAASRSNATHGGVSAFGATVIGEMNRLGIMVDLSHGGERSFYDALEISSTPVVCSHSNCRSLCDHQRNLTDDQLRALARKGGVAHTTFYPGFLWDGKSASSVPHRSGTACVMDALEHLNHAIDIMGIDHVGIGTDFDGDGGVSGMNDSSDAMNFTMHLLRKRYSEEDIRKIWGGNWLRVMSEVQNKSIV